MYFTDKKTNRTIHSWSSEEFKKFSEALKKFNQPYDEAFITVVNLEEDYYLEHNVSLSIDEVNILKKFEKDILYETNKSEN